MVQMQGQTPRGSPLLIGEFRPDNIYTFSALSQHSAFVYLATVVLSPSVASHSCTFGNSIQHENKNAMQEERVDKESRFD
jgi:hypothetical protein